MSLLRRAVVIFVLVSLAACGGGGGGGDDGATSSDTSSGDQGRRGDERSGSGSGGGSPPTFTVGGTISGLTGSGLVLQNNGADPITPGNGPFTFPTALLGATDYSVTVAAQPTNPTQTCAVVANGTGTIADRTIDNVQVNCTTNAYAVGGTASGLSGPGLILRNNGGDNLPVDSDGPFVFATAVASNSVYQVTIAAAPAGKSCSLANTTGTISNAAVANVVVTCTDTPPPPPGPLPSFALGGSISGLAGTELELSNNGGDTFEPGSNGAFNFPTPVPHGGAYDVTVTTQPNTPAQTCTVTNGSGTGVTADVANIQVNCTTNSYAVGGTVSGLSGTGLTLQNNFGNDLSVGANGSFTFTQTVTSGSNYIVRVIKEPTNPSQTCTVSNDAGLVADAAVTNIVVTCAPWTKQLGTSGYDGVYAVTTDASDNLYAAIQVAAGLDGNTAFGAADVFVVKYRADGQKVWSSQIGSAGNDLVNGIAVDASGNVYVVGGTAGNFQGTNAGSSDAFVAKLGAADGAFLWSRQFGTAVFDAANAVAVGADGVYVVGETDGNLGSGSVGNSDVFARKYDFAGNVAWSRQFGTAVYDAANAVSVDASGVYLAGETDGALPGRNARGNSDIFAAMLNPGTGNVDWTAQFGTQVYDAAKAIAVDNTNIYVAGETDGNLDGVNAGDSDIFVARLNKLDGARLWTRQFGSPAYDAARGVAVDSNGVYLSGEADGALPAFAGAANSSIGRSDAFVSRYALDGTAMWTRQFGTSLYDAANGIAVDGAGIIYLGGETDGALPNGHLNFGGSDAFIVRYGSDGTQK